MPTIQSATIAEIPATYEAPIEIPPNINSASGGLLLAIPAAISLIGWGARELTQLYIRRQTARLDAELEKQKAEQQEKTERIEYLENQNQLLLNEILSLNRMMERSAPLSLKMYEPTKPQPAS